MTFDATRRWVVVTMLAVVAAMSLSVVAQQGQDGPQAQFERARLMEENSKTLNEAIVLYKQVAAQAGSNRALAARALLRAAEGHQKLGDAEARTIYKRIVREFPDRKEEVALASARLGGAAPVVSAKGDRAVWIGPNVDPYGRVSPDGKFITHRDSDGGHLMIHDIAANVERVLTPPEPAFNWSQFAHESRISRDGKQVVYVWWDNYAGARLRLATLQESGFLEPREVFRAGCSADACPFIGSFDWSPDGKWIAAAIPLKDRTYQIALIAVADGSSRVLKSMDGEPKSIFFSPDSKYIAYDRPVTDASPQRDVFVLAIDGSREIPVVVYGANDAVMGWSPDGTRLLFSSDRTGSVALWALTFADGRAQGSPELLKSDIGSSVSQGLTASGALYVHRRINTRDITIAPIDLEAGKLLGTTVSFTQGFVEGARNPAWSPDGRYLAYPVDCNNGCVAIRSVATGQVRRLASALTESRVVSWSPDGRSLLMKSTDVRGREGIFQIDVQSGEATPVFLGDGLTVLAQWSPDGRKVYFNRRGVFVERDLASGAERVVNRDLGVGTGNLSPDGQYFVVARTDPPTKTANLLLVPVAGSQPRELLRLTQPEVIGRNAWTPDSSAVIIVKDTGSRRELWLVPVTGSQPRKLDIDPNIWMEGSAGAADQGFSLSPDGRSIAFQTGKTVSEVWALENFLPSAPARR